MARRTGLKTVPLAQVESYLERARCGNFDEYVHLGDLRFVPSGQDLEDFHERLRLLARMKGKETGIQLREQSLTQCCRFLGMPPYFGEKLPAALAANLLNYLLTLRAEELVLLRLRPGPRPLLRAMLKANFARVNDQPIFAGLRQPLADSGMQTQDVLIEEDAFHLRLVKEEPFDVGHTGAPDLVRLGVDVLNSETGAHRLSVRIVLVREICSNGMTIGNNIYEGLSIRQDRMDADEARRAVACGIRQLLEDSGALIERYRALHGQRIQDPRAELSEFFAKNRLGSPRGRIAQRIVGEIEKATDLFGCTRFDFVQAITAVARSMEIDRRLQFEDAVGWLIAEVGCAA